MYPYQITWCSRPDRASARAGSRTSQDESQSLDSTTLRPCVKRATVRREMLQELHDQVQWFQVSAFQVPGWGEDGESGTGVDEASEGSRLCGPAPAIGRSLQAPPLAGSGNAAAEPRVHAASVKAHLALLHDLTEERLTGSDLGR